MNNKLSNDKYYIIEFISKFIVAGLILLWVSGGAFLGYYYLFTPELLLNQKIWAKLFIVLILTVNGILVHQHLLPKIKESIGHPLMRFFDEKDFKRMTTIGVISFISWLFPIVLGVSKTLNFSVPAIHIITFYLAVITLTFIIANYLSAKLFKLKEQTI